MATTNGTPETPSAAPPTQQQGSSQPEAGASQAPSSVGPSASEQKPSKSGKKPAQDKPAAAAGADTKSAETATDKKISGAELKKRAKEEKAARRAAEKAAKEGPAPAAAAAVTAATPSKAQQGQKGGAGNGAQRSQQGGQGSHHRRAPSQGAAGQQNLPFRGKAAPASGAPAVPKAKKVNKEVGLFGHLYSQPKRHTLEGVSKEVHPAVLALGLQMSSYVVCGSNARCVGMLLAFKKAIQAYQTPNGTSLARHLTSHHLSPQIDYLKSHRPISVSMGNAIRWLKDYIIHIDPDTPESAAKEDICGAIDLFIRERITVADTAIAATACVKIRQGSTVVTFGKSSIVEKTLLRASELGTKFKVVVIDSRPLFEGKNLARSLAAAGIETSYMLHTAVSHALKDADLVLLGAHAMMSNGRLYSRVGTAAVAMLAHSRDVPVIVLAESIKFTDRVALDSIVLNELAPPDELVIPADHHNSSTTEPSHPDASKAKAGSNTSSAANKKREEEEKNERKSDAEASSLAGWRDVQGLQLLNIMYDVTPAEYINMVITEYGSLPPSSVPVVHRISTERDVRT
ncbi:hypothetical protein AAFC00_002756 [Neodothiora populina]|uniref:Translation initiation factor eIF2B subunit delta n=1 Tax=Neodothiora populina TaxID=2781224 RepID=A0ABR3P8A2_9PEZI